jgi:hypothetical protein
MTLEKTLFEGEGRMLAKISYWVIGVVMLVSVAAAQQTSEVWSITRQISLDGLLAFIMTLVTVLCLIVIYIIRLEGKINLLIAGQTSTKNDLQRHDGRIENIGKRIDNLFEKGK